MQEDTLREKQAVQLRLQGAMDMQTALEKSYEAKVHCPAAGCPCPRSPSDSWVCQWEHGVQVVTTLGAVRAAGDKHDKHGVMLRNVTERSSLMLDVYLMHVPFSRRKRWP